MARKLVVTNRKGGTGKTASVVNLAAEIAARGQRVLLVDLDTQGHCAVGLGVRVEKGEPTVHGVFAGINDLNSALRQTAWENLDLIPADPLFDHGSGSHDEFLLARQLSQEGLLGKYDMVIFDTPPSLDVLLVNALHAADRVLVPFQPHFLAAEGVRQLARVLFRVGNKRANPALRVLGFLPVMSDMRIGQHRQITASVSHQFGTSRMLPGVRNDIRIPEAFGAGQPLRYFAPKSRAALDYKLVVDWILERWI